MRLIDADALIGPIKLQEESYRRCGAIERAEAYVNCLLEIELAPTIDGWISVKDRLPEKQIPVLVYVPPYSNENEEYTEYVGVAYYTYSALGGYWAGTDGNVYGAIGIIHDPIYWMPLPEPPKEENSGNEQHMP